MTFTKTASQMKTRFSHSVCGCNHLHAPQDTRKWGSIRLSVWEGSKETQLAEQNDIGLGSPNRRVIKAWMHQDEPDNAQPIGLGLYGRCIPATEVVRRSREMKPKTRRAAS
jgi:hypothetical protein